MSETSEFHQEPTKEEVGGTTVLSGQEQISEEINRRKFLTTMLGLTGSVIGLSLSVPLVGYALSPALVKEKTDFVPIGSIADYKAGEPTKVNYSYKKKDGWVDTEVRKSAWVVKKDDNNITVFSPNCTHLGCGYAWDSAAQQFKCPCHGAVFSVEGEILAGPPPRPLDRFETKVAEGKLFIGKLVQGEG